MGPRGLEFKTWGHGWHARRPGAPAALVPFTAPATSWRTQHQWGDKDQSLLVLSLEEIRGTEERWHFWNCAVKGGRGMEQPLQERET